MPQCDAIQADGRVIEVLSERLFRVELPNGHRIMGHVPRRMPLGEGGPQAGCRVRVEMSPFDMSEGRIVNWNGFET